MLISRGCTTESKFYISIYIYYCENKRNLIFFLFYFFFFLQLNFWGFLQVLISKNVRFHVKVIHKKFGDILLIFKSCTTESKSYISIYIYIYITVRIKKIDFFCN